MSALIKSSAAPALRAFAGPSAHQAKEQPPQVIADPRDAEIAALRRRVTQLQEEVEASYGEIAEALAAARREGIREGEALAGKRDEERLSLLQNALVEANHTFDKQLQVVEGLAPRLARASLGKIFSDPDSWTAMVLSALERQLAQLRRGSVVSIHVSAEDFAEGLPALHTIPATIDPGLRAGAARLACKLGQIDIDIREQWNMLVDVLDRMGAE